MKKTTGYALALAGALVASPALADDTQAWADATVQVGLGGPFKVLEQTELHTSDAKGFYEAEQHLLLGYKLDKHTTAWIGYTFNPLYNHGSFNTTENRIRSQVTFDNIAKLGAVNVSARLRMETRWRDGFTGTGWRVRPYVKFSLPLQGKTSLNLTTEPYFNLNTTGFQKQSGLERARTSLMISTPLVKKVTVSFGYLNQHGFVRGGPDTDDHVANLSLTASF